MKIKNLKTSFDDLFFSIMRKLFPKAYSYKKLRFRSISEMIKDIEDFEKEHPFVSKIENIYFYINRGITNILYIPKKIKWYLQRAKRGYADCDLWEFGVYISHLIKNALEDFRKNLTGNPTNLTYKEWLKILDNIIYSFDIAQKTLNDEVIMPSLKDLKKHPKKWKKYAKDLNAKLLTEKEIKKYERGMKLFIQYLFDLWD